MELSFSVLFCSFLFCSFTSLAHLRYLKVGFGVAVRGVSGVGCNRNSVWPFTYSYNASIARPLGPHPPKQKEREEKKEKCAVTLDVDAVAGKREIEKVIKWVTMMMMMVMAKVKMDPLGTLNTEKER